MENHEIIEKAIAYAKGNATNAEITVQDVAINAGFSIDYFNRIFLTHTGYTVMAYVNDVRLKKAAVLLRTTDKSLLDIALDVGYSSHEGFTKAFKKKYGQTPSVYRSQLKNKLIAWGEMADRATTAQWIYANPDFKPIDTQTVIERLLETDAVQHARICAEIKYLGFQVAAPNGDFGKGFLCVGDDRKQGSWLEAVSDDLSLLSEWVVRFPNLRSFYSTNSPEMLCKALKDKDVCANMKAVPQSVYIGDKIKCVLPEWIKIRPLGVQDIPLVVKWADGKKIGNINHLLQAKCYSDDSVLEYGVFQNGELIAVAGCGLDEVNGLKINDCCDIRFADTEATDALYQMIFSYVVNDLLERGVLPFDNIQYGDYAEKHGHFTAVDLGFRIVNWKYCLKAE